MTGTKRHRSWYALWYVVHVLSSTSPSRKSKLSGSVVVTRFETFEVFTRWPLINEYLMPPETPTLGNSRYSSNFLKPEEPMISDQYKVATSQDSQYPQVDRRSDLSVREFKREYLYPGKPVVITDAIGEWKAK